MDKKNKSQRNIALILTFFDAVKSCDEIKDAFKPGFLALKANSKVLYAENTKLINGSVDIDEAVKAHRPNEARWDYVVGYANEAYFIEVHPANTSNVEEMVKKVTWLKNWLETKAPNLKALNKNEVYYWVPSGKVKILKGSVQDRKIAANHLQIKNKVTLPSI